MLPTCVTLHVIVLGFDNDLPCKLGPPEMASPLAQTADPQEHGYVWGNIKAS